MFSVLPEVLSRQVLLHTIQNDQKSNKTEITDNLVCRREFGFRERSYTVFFEN